MEIQHTSFEGKHLVSPRGDMVFETAHRLRDFIAALLKGDGYCFTLDLAGVSNIDSAGIGVILTLSALLWQQGRSFQIRNASPRVMETIRLAGSGGLLPLLS